jgi:hypothetical protein
VYDRTVQCKALKDVKAVLKLLKMHKGFAVLLIKDRLMLAFDASVSGGYRDLLLNLRCVATGHIVELQITLKGLMEVKAGGGHASYAIARVHGLFERRTYRYEGALGAAVLKGVRCGVVRELVCRGKASGLTAHFDSLLESLRAPACGLSELVLAGCDWPEGHTLSSLVEALPARGLKTLDITAMQVGGALPEALGDKCAGAELVALSGLGLTGGVPASLGKCAKLKTLYLWENKLEGSIPDELGQCGELEALELQTNQLTGGVPASLGKCAKLKTLMLAQNQLEGPIPDELGQCGELEVLDLAANQLTGGVPASLGKCAKLKTLLLHKNQLEGAIPDELGQCGELEVLDLSSNQLTGGVPASLGKCAKLKGLFLHTNRLEGAVPATELAKLTALTDLHLNVNKGLTIMASGAQELKKALPNAKLCLPTEVAG